MFSKGHIIYIILSTLAIILALFNTNKIKNIKKFKFYLGLILFIIMVINRAALAYYGNIYTKYSPHVTAFMMFPNSWCSAASITLSICLMLDVKHRFICFPIWLAIFGGIMATIMPVYLNEQPHTELDTITSLIFHSIMIFAAFFLLISKEYKPQKYDFLEFTLGMLLISFIGIIQKLDMHYEYAMQIDEPFLTSTKFLKILSCNWIIIIVCSLFIMLVHNIIIHFETKTNLEKELSETQFVQEVELSKTQTQN